MSLLTLTDRDLFCPLADVYIDAWKPVRRNIVTHAHADHARRVADEFLAPPDGVALLKHRLGQDIRVQALPYREKLSIHDVHISLHPAGHILGACQVRIEHRGEVWLFTGDYKRQPDATAQPFELIGCHTLITECTFGLPLFHWPDPALVATQINSWWRNNIMQNRTSILLAYSLGKAQRVLSLLDSSIGPILLHGAVHAMTETYRASNIDLPPADYASPEAAKLYRGRALVIAPPSAINSPWIRKFSPVSTGVASGWMQIRGFRRRKSVDRGFVLSDHADWSTLLDTIQQTGATSIIATHGYTGPFAKYLNERGLSATAFETRFKQHDDDDESESPVGEPKL